MKPLLTSVTGVAFLFLVVASLQAELIAPLIATGSSDNAPSRAISYAVDGSGLSGNQHTSLPDPNMWLSVANDPAPWYKIDLGDSFVVQHQRTSHGCRRLFAVIHSNVLASLRNMLVHRLLP